MQRRRRATAALTPDRRDRPDGRAGAPASGRSRSGPGFDGRDWVAGNQGTVRRRCRAASGAVRTLALREPIAEDIATDPTGTYVVTTRALYRLRASADGTPRVDLAPCRSPPG